jgi:hypothetical protein
LDTRIFRDEDGVDMMELAGRASPHTHQAFMIPLDNHSHGLSFSVACRNRHKAVVDQIFWRKYVPSRHDLNVSTTFSLVGDMMQVPNSPEIKLDVTVHHVRGKGHLVESVQMEFPVDYYALFINRLK